MNPKIYLETSLFGFYIDENEGAMHRSTVRLFEMIAEGKFEAYTSEAVIKELTDTKDKERQNKLLNLIKNYNISILPETEEAINLTEYYILAGTIPAKFRTDALHIAIAKVNKIDTIISNNFRHIVKNKTKDKTKFINSQRGYNAIKICAPMEVEEYEKKI